MSAPAAIFAGTLGTRIRLLAARDPESKGMIERNNGFFETSFLPGRTFTGPADFNAQLSGGCRGPTPAWSARPGPGRWTLWLSIWPR